MTDAQWAAGEGANAMAIDVTDAVLWGLLFAGGCFLATNAVLLLALRKPLIGLWREPVLRVPVVIFESDDWGPGPAEQAGALERLRSILCRHVDSRGRHPVMTLGLTLAAPQAGPLEIHAGGYRRILLDDPAYAGILEQIRAGIAEGVFAPQLHGMEHFFPDVLLDVATRDASVRDWLERGDQYTELLPPHVQSRWLDARVLPTCEFDDDVIRSAVGQEVAAFERIFHQRPRVVVPPTFACTRAVERAWCEAGLEYLVSCGRRLIGRGADGKMIHDPVDVRNADKCSGLTCLVRDVYFEPAKGHRSDRLIAALEQYTLCARPLLLETHRSNFTSINPHVERAFGELDRALDEVLTRFPEVRFMSSEALGDAIAGCDPELLFRRAHRPLQVWLRRVRGLLETHRVARLSGLSLLFAVLPLRQAANRSHRV